MKCLNVSSDQMFRICPLGVKSCFYITGKYEDQSEIWDINEQDEVVYAQTLHCSLSQVLGYTILILMSNSVVWSLESPTFIKDGWKREILSCHLYFICRWQTSFLENELDHKKQLKHVLLQLWYFVGVRRQCMNTTLDVTVTSRWERTYQRP